MKVALFSCVAALCGLLLSAPVQAGMITYSGTVPLQLTELVNAAPNPALPQYNAAAIPGAGTLLSATVTYRGFGSTTFSFQNVGAVAGFYRATADTIFNANSAVSGLNTLLAPLTGQTQVSTVGYPTYISIAAGATQSYGPVSYNTGVASSTFTNPIDLAYFIGNGNLSLLANTTSIFGLSSFGGNVQGAQTSFAGADFTVTYTYDDVAAVPEPSTFVLAACGLVGLVGVRYRRRNTAK